MRGALLCIGLALVPFQASADPITVPFRLHGQHIYLEGAINGAPATLVLDSGAGADVVTPAAVERLGLKLTGASGTALGAGGSASVKIAELDSIGLPGAVAQNQKAYVIALPEGLPCDGLLGTPFFRHWVVSIDYGAGKLTLTPRDEFKPDADASAFDIKFISETVHIQATVDGFSGLFKLDTGAADGLTLFGPFVEKNGMRGKYSPSIKMVTGRGVGGLLYGDEVRIPTLDIGPFEFHDVAATLSTQKSGAFADPNLAGNIGAEILQRFIITFDEAGKKLYLVRSPLYGKPFRGNRSGLATDIENGLLRVRTVVNHSPAMEAGIREGDAILAINGRETGTLKPWEPRDLLYGDVGTVVKLKVRTADEAPRDVSITLRDLF